MATMKRNIIGLTGLFALLASACIAGEQDWDDLQEEEVGIVAQEARASHIIIARAGASSVSEISCVGRPVIFVPLKIAADDHQTANAEGLVEAGAADSIPEHEFNVEALASLLEVRLANHAELSDRATKVRALGRPDAASLFADALISLEQGH